MLVVDIAMVYVLGLPCEVYSLALMVGSLPTKMASTVCKSSPARSATTHRFFIP